VIVMGASRHHRHGGVREHWERIGCQKRSARRSISLVSTVAYLWKPNRGGCSMMETPHRKSLTTEADRQAARAFDHHTETARGKRRAIGLSVRAHGRGKSIRFFQFMKVAAARFGDIERWNGWE